MTYPPAQTIFLAQVSPGVSFHATNLIILAFSTSFRADFRILPYLQFVLLTNSGLDKDVPYMFF